MHPIDQLILPEMKISSINLRSNNYKSETTNLIQRQRVIKSFLYRPDENEPSIRKPSKLSSIPKELSITSISSPQILFAELNEQSPTNINRQSITNKKDSEHQSPLLARRQRTTVENLSPIQQVADITNLLPSHFTFRNGKTSRITPSERSPLIRIPQRVSSPRVRPLNNSKTLNEHTTTKSSLSSSRIFSSVNNTHTWMPKISEPSSNYTRTLTGLLRAKSQLVKYAHQRTTSNNPKPSYVQDLYISPRPLNNLSNDTEFNRKLPTTKFILDDWNDRKIADEDESISTDGNSSTSTCISQLSAQSSDHTTIDLTVDSSKLQTPRLPVKRTFARRRPYNLVLEPVVEHLDDDDHEQTGDVY